MEFIEGFMKVFVLLAEELSTMGNNINWNDVGFICGLTTLSLVISLVMIVFAYVLARVTP